MCMRLLYRETARGECSNVRGGVNLQTTCTDWLCRHAGRARFTLRFLDPSNGSVIKTRREIGSAALQNAADPPLVILFLFLL